MKTLSMFASLVLVTSLAAEGPQFVIQRGFTITRAAGEQAPEAAKPAAGIKSCPCSDACTCPHCVTGQGPCPCVERTLRLQPGWQMVAPPVFQGAPFRTPARGGRGGC